MHDGKGYKQGSYYGHSKHYGDSRGHNHQYRDRTESQDSDNYEKFPKKTPKETKKKSETDNSKTLLNV